MEELKKPQRSVSSTKNHGLGSRGSPVLGEFLRVILRWFGPRSTFWQVRYVASCFFCCVTPLLHRLLLCVSPYRKSFIAGTCHCPSACPCWPCSLFTCWSTCPTSLCHQRRVSVLLGSRCGKKLSTMGVVYKTKGCTIRKQEVVVKNKGLW